MTDLFSTVNINSSFQRSARIDNKISKEFLDNFVFHDTSKKVLNQINLVSLLQVPMGQVKVVWHYFLKL